MTTLATSLTPALTLTVTLTRSITCWTLCMSSMSHAVTDALWKAVRNVTESRQRVRTDKPYPQFVFAHMCLSVEPAKVVSFSDDEHEDGTLPTPVVCLNTLMFNLRQSTVGRRARGEASGSFASRCHVVQQPSLRWRGRGCMYSALLSPSLSSGVFTLGYCAAGGRYDVR